MKMTILRPVQTLALLGGLLFMNSLFVSGQLQTNKSFKADHTADEQKALAVSATGDIYVSINAKSLNLLNADGSYTDIVNPHNTTARGGILAKLDVEGNLLWSGIVSSAFAGSKNSQITSVCEVGDYLYVVGGVCVSAASPAKVSVFGVELESQGFMDYYIAKLDAKTGQAVWVKTYGGTRDWEMFNAVAADEKGNIYAVATFGNVTAAPLEFPLKDGSKTSLSVTGNWGEDYLIARFNIDGEMLWAKSVGSKFRENGAPSVAVDGNGDAVLCGIFNAANGNLTNETEEKREFVIGEQRYVLFPQQSKESAVVKFASADGTILWSRYFSGTGNQEINKVTVLAGSNKIVIAGKADNAIVVQGSNGFPEITETHITGGYHLFTMGFAGDGTFLWNRSAADDTSSDVKAIAADGNGNVFIAGNFNGSLTLGEGITMQKTGSGAQEGYFAKLNGEGKCLLMETVKGSGNENINLIAISGDKLAITGDRTTDVTLPYGDKELGKSVYTANGANHKWFMAVYTMKPSLSGLSTLEGRRFVPFTYSYVPAFFEMPCQFAYTKPTTIPSGWDINETTGVISGKATEVGSGSIILKVTNILNNESVERVIPYTIVPKPCEILSIQPESIAPKAVIGPFYQKFTLENGEGNIVWSAQGLPKGLSIDSKTGVVSGTLLQTGNLSFTVTAREESGCESSRTYTAESETFNYTLAPHVKWSNRIFAPDAFDHAKINAIDNEGNIWIAASYFSAGFSDKIAFPNVGNTDALVAKYNGKTGEFMLARRIGGSEVAGRNEQGQAVATDPQTGDVVFTGIVNPDAYIGDLNETDTYPTNGARDIGVVRFDKEGNKLWYKTFGSSADWEAGINTTFDKKGNIYVIGYTSTKDIIIPMADGSSETLAGTSSDVVVLKLNGSGEALWAKRLGTTNGTEQIYGLTIDDSNNVYIAGILNNGTIAFGNGKTMVADGVATFVSKYNELGVCQWVTTIGSKGSFITGSGSALALDAKGNLYVAGIAQGTSTIAGQPQTIVADAAKTDGVILKLNGNGEYVWHKLLASVSNDGVTSVAVDKNNNVYAVGYYEAEMPVYESIRLQLVGTRTAFVFKYNELGEYVYAFSTGSTVTDATRPTNLAISIDKATDDLIITGPYLGTAYPYGMSGKSKSLDNTSRFLLLRYSQNAGIFGVFHDCLKGEEYKTSVSVTGFQNPMQIVYSIDNGTLPDGLSLNAQTGEVSGILNATGAFKFTIKATDGVTTATQEFSFNGTGADCALSVDFDAAFADGAVNGKIFTAELYADNAVGNVTWSLDEGSVLPAGLAIGSKFADVGVISGTPNAPAKEYSFTVVAQDENGCRATRQIYLTISGVNSIDRQLINNLSICPNIVKNGVLNLQLGEIEANEYQLEIIDIPGNILYTEKAHLEAGMLKVIDVKNIVTGCYLVRIKNKTTAVSLQFIIQ